MWGEGTINFPRLKSLFIAILAFLSSRIQGNQATTITISPSSMAVRSSAIQMDLTTKSLSFIRTNTASFQTTFVASSSSSFHTSSLSSISQSLVHSRYTKTFTSTVTCVTPTSLIPVTQSNYTMPTSVVTIKGLPSIKVITAIAGVLGAILLVLLAIIIWDLCIVEVLPRRPTSRVEPSDVSVSVSEMVWACPPCAYRWTRRVTIHDVKFRQFST